ncbi:hypothetical protein [Rhizobium sp. ICMP 5592]|uniref:hypothetical protein n=1 Tax=Rhizobium sp. ICMP 5592 TaxID=2292445 RepID=UPI001296968E|nr:hypothetical protein [Rhizobium sp. ICMP 5592]MQB43317.1 hypothetical protein [Rhizobium sp. ICMP 5592]
MAIFDDLKVRSIAELLKLHAAVNEELRNRNVLRTANSPTGDLAEYLFCQAFGWKQYPNSERSFDATDESGVRYQIKGRRIHIRNKSRQLSAIRDLAGFDFIAAVLFDDYYRVTKAALIPASVAHTRSKYVERTNSHKFMLRDDVWQDAGVVDVTHRLLAVENR